MRILLGCVLCTSLTAGIEPKIVPFRLYAAFQHEPPSSIFSDIRTELDSIMAPIGWDITWTPMEATAGLTAVSLAIVRFNGKCDVDGTVQRFESVHPLGESYLDNGEMLPFSTIYCDAIRSFLYSSIWSVPMDVSHRYARAVARVLAHELFHVLTGDKRHAGYGLLQEQLTPAELLSSTLRFQPEQVERLRVKLVRVLIDENPGSIDGDQSPGYRTYVLAGCSGCHGMVAQGTPRGPALRESGRTYDTAALQLYLSDRRSAMYQKAKTLHLVWPVLKARDVDMLAHFLGTLH